MSLPNDARVYAASILQEVENEPRHSPFICYGTAGNVTVGLRRKRSLNIVGDISLDQVWATIDNFIKDNAGEFIVGFIGFDPSNELCTTVEDYRQKIDLFVPETVIECTGSGYVVRSGGWKPDVSRPPAIDIQSNILDPVYFDSESLQNDYRKAVVNVLESIHCGMVERVTLARRIDVERSLDMVATFLADGSRHACARNFFFANDFTVFSGQSPELLAEGSTACFDTHKLSGTYFKDPNLSVEKLSQLFLADERIRSEHNSSVAAIEKSLAGLGKLECNKFRVMELPDLLHGWSRFTTRPERTVSIANCLRAIFPFGVQPWRRGLELIKQHENYPRGPYYGLVGCIQPNGHFSFTQVLRSAFADRRSNYLMVGAAITRRSTPELEVSETCAKLSGVRIFEKRKFR